MHFIFFYKILHFMRNPTKFGSSKLDTPSSRYDFPKLVQKSGKEQNQTLTAVADTWDPRVSGPHMSVNRNRARWLTGASSLTTSFSTKPTPPSCSTQSPASTGTSSGGANTLERACRRPWRHGGAAWRCADRYWPWQGPARSSWAPW